MRAASFTSEVVLPVGAADAYAWHARPGAFERLVPPWERLSVRSRTGGLEDGAEVTLELRAGPFRRTWVARHHDVTPGRSFADTMERGPFAAWTHVHRFLDDEGGCLLRDEVTYRLPFGPLGRVAAPLVRRKLDRTFAFRQRRLAHDLERHAMTTTPLRIAVTGASGLVGGALTSLLTTGGHQVLRLTRSPAREGDIAVARDGTVADPAALEGVDAVVHLAGENIGKRWTEERKREIERSRVEGTHALVSALGSLARPPRVLVSASAVGIYGNRGAEILTERSIPGDDFLAGVCRRWEAAANEATASGIRVVTPRFGVVLEALLHRLLRPFRLGVGGPVGSGRQWLSWVALDDLVSAILFVIVTDELTGPVNIVAPGVVTNRELAQTLGRVLRRPAVLPLPAAAARLALGELADGLLLASQRATPVVLTEAGYRFAYPTLEGALRHVLGR